MLQQKARTQLISLTNLMNKAVVEYFPLKQENERKRSIERELAEIKHLYSSSKTERSFYENTKLEFHFNQLRGKEVKKWRVGRFIPKTTVF